MPSSEPTVRTEYYKRGVFGWLFKLSFIAFNVFMVVWLVAYWSRVADLSNPADSGAARVGAAIGVSIGTGAIIFLWVSGAIILGLLTYFTRGNKIILEAGEGPASWGGRVGVALAAVVIALAVTIALVGTPWRSDFEPAVQNIDRPNTAADTKTVNDSVTRQATSSSQLASAASTLPPPADKSAIIADGSATQRELGNLLDILAKFEPQKQSLEVQQQRINSIVEKLSKVTEALKRIPPSSVHYKDARLFLASFEEAEQAAIGGAHDIEQTIRSQTLDNLKRRPLVSEGLLRAKLLLECIPESSPRYGEAQRLMSFFDKIESDIKSGTGWIVSQEKSKIDDSTNVYLQLSSKEPIANQLREMRNVELFIMCREGKTDLYFVFGGYFMANIEGYGTVTYRIDVRPAATKQFTESTDHKALGLWHGQGVPLIKEMFNSSTLFVRATPYNESSVTAEFNISGLKEAIKPLRAACGWADTAPSLSATHH